MSHEYQWNPDDGPPDDADAAMVAHLHGFLEQAIQAFAVRHVDQPLSPHHVCHGVLQFAACTIDRLATQAAAGEAEAHVGTLLGALGAFYALLATGAPRPLPWPDRPPGAEDLI